MIPGVKGSLVYYISHNITRKELLPDGHGGFKGEGWVHRKGRDAGVSSRASGVEGNTVRGHRSSDPVAGQSDRRQPPSWSPIRRACGGLLGESWCRSRDGPQDGGSHVGSENRGRRVHGQ